MKTSWRISIIFRNTLSRLCEKRSDDAIAEFGQPGIGDRRIPSLPSVLAWTLSAIFVVAAIPLQTVNAANPPKELQRIIDNFMNMESRSMEIHQVIDWKYRSDHDSVRFQMDIRGNRNFHLDIIAYGLEIFVTESEMLTLNHIRKQIIYENTTPDALLKQLFVGGDLRDARFRREEQLEDGRRELEFRFSDDFSDWERLSILLGGDDAIQRIKLIDYDGNIYHIRFKYLPRFQNYVLPDINIDYPRYRVADLRK